MFGSVNLSTDTIENLVLGERNAKLDFMGKLIDNAERHGESPVAHELSQTFSDELFLSSFELV